MSTTSATTTSGVTQATGIGVSANSPSTSSLGLGSGLDLNSIIDGLMNVEGAQQTKLKSKVTQHNSLVGIYQQLNAKFSTLQTASQGLNLPSSWQIKAATSSSTNVTATATTSAIAGSLSFVVKNLATAQTLASSGSVASTDSIIASGNMLLGKGGALGLGNVSGSGLAAGAHTIAVTQASTGATQNGTAAVANSVTFTGNETITANVGGVAKTFTMTAGTYNRSDLAQMITKVSGGSLNASINNDNSLKLASADEGSASSLQITGGTGRSA